MMDINLEAGHIVEITTAPSTPPKKLSVPILGLEKFPTQQEIEGQDIRNRRPVRPIDRQRMRPWLMELLDLGNVFGLRWTNRNQGIFQISWRHASRLGWNLETDGDVFERWARHTGIYKEGDPPEPKRWKANFRCALHSLHDVMELTNAVERRGRNACRTYQFLQNNAVNPKARSKEKRQKPIEPKEPRELLHLLTYERPIRPPVQLQLPESGSSDELLSETESESSQHQDRVIVQRLGSKSGELGEEEFLLHDHDYSGHQENEKTQRTIYLRQGVGSIVLHKEVLNAPQILEDAKAAEALSNLEQLASAAVDSQELGGGTIMIDANVLSGGSNKNSPTKSSTFDEDDSTLSLKTLLPRLRARIKESERTGGFYRKRKTLEGDFEIGEKKILGHNQYRLKKSKSEISTSPPSPPLTRRRSGSPQKQSKSSGKTKRSRKESEGSASDSTEPLMSSCLLLLEAATRLDKAEKGEGLSEKRLSKHGRKGGDKSSSVLVNSKKKRGVRSIRFEEGEQQEVIEEPVLEGIDAMEGVDEETVIEEKIIYPDGCVQIVYQEALDENTDQTSTVEIGEGEEPVVYDILRSALENIGSEMEVSTSSEVSSPKEMAIMRRKKDNEKISSSSLYNALAVSGGQIVVTEASFAKGLFSGSEIVPSISSGPKKAAKIKSKSLANKDNIYYVDVRSNGGSICVKQSDNSYSHSDSFVSGSATAIPAVEGITSSVSSPQIFIAAGQNSSSQQIVMPVKNQNLKTTTATVNLSSLQQQQSADLATLKQAISNMNSGKSFISLSPQGKPIILKSSNTTAKIQDVSPSSSVPVTNQIGSQALPPNVKISTLPIISTLKPIVSIPAATTSIQKKSIMSPTVTSSSVYPMHLFQNLASSPQATANSGQQQQQTMTMVSTKIETDGQETKTYYIQPQLMTSTLEDQNTKQQTKPLKFHLVTSDDSQSSSTASQSVSTSFQQTEGLTSSMLSTSTTDDKTKRNEDTISAEVVIDPIKGPYLKLPMLSTTIPLSHNLVLSSSPSTTATETEMAVSLTNETETQQLHQESALSSAHTNFQVSDLSEVEIYSVNNGNQVFVDNSKDTNNDNIAENVVKPEHPEFSEHSSLTVVQNEGEDGQLVFTVKQEGAASLESYCIPSLQDHESQQIETNPSSTDDGNNIRVEVQTEMGDQTCFISPEQLEQANHIIHISQELVEEASSSTSKIKIETSGMENERSESDIPVPVEEYESNVKSEVEVEEEEYSVTVPCSSSISIDPRAPLAIQEIPLFASSKGDSDSVEEHST